IWDSLHGERRLADLIPNGTGWEIWNGTAISDSGTIAGYGRLNGELRGFIAIPVPETSTSAFCACAFVLIVSTLKFRDMRLYQRTDNTANFENSKMKGSHHEAVQKVPRRQEPQSIEF
ncbi:MAG TPA: hypothetical protein VHU84_11555, partial [Lacipirellulaceae bacterium]|nr:hypothetical protein [Lacipirellulaceae bacterium]